MHEPQKPNQAHFSLENSFWFLSLLAVVSLSPVSLPSKSLFNRVRSRLKLEKAYLFMCRMPDSSVNHWTVRTEKGPQEGKKILYCTVLPQPVPVEGRQSNSLFRDSVDFAILLARIGLRCTASSPVFYWAENIGESASELHASRGEMDMKFWRIVLCRVRAVQQWQITRAKTRHGNFQLLYTSQFAATS